MHLDGCLWPQGMLNFHEMLIVLINTGLHRKNAIHHLRYAGYRLKEKSMGVSYGRYRNFQLKQTTIQKSYRPGNRTYAAMHSPESTSVPSCRW
jgi:hypothetical protein